jgi:hypothetical protein
MIQFPNSEFVRALKLANRATRRGDVKATSRWLRVAEHHMKLYRIYNAAEDEGTERERVNLNQLAALPVGKVNYRYFTNPADTPEAFAELQKRFRRRKRS